MTNQSSGMTLSKTTDSYLGNPSLTVPGVGGLAPGRSGLVRLQFNNPGDVKVTFEPAAYTGNSTDPRLMLSVATADQLPQSTGRKATLLELGSWRQVASFRPFVFTVWAAPWFTSSRVVFFFSISSGRRSTLLSSCSVCRCNLSALVRFFAMPTA